MSRREPKLLDVKTVLDGKFLSMYEANYQIDGGEIFWSIASRRKVNNLELKAKSKNADGVRILPFSKINGRTIIYLIKQFRFPVNDYVYEFPAGLVDVGEQEDEALQRELFEEIGAKVLSVKPLFRNLYTSVGMSDEKISYFEAEVELCGAQTLEKEEYIEIVPMTMTEAEELLLSDKNLSCDTAFLLQNFILKEKFLQK